MSKRFAVTALGAAAIVLMLASTAHSETPVSVPD